MNRFPATIQTPVTPEMKAALEEYARQEQRSRAFITRLAIEEFLERHNPVLRPSFSKPAPDGGEGE